MVLLANQTWHERKSTMQVLGIFGIIAALLIGSIGGSYFQRRSFARDAQNLAYYEKTYLWKQGAMIGFGNYDLRSFDGGKQWYAVSRKDDGAIVILGAAEEIFPGLLASINGMDALVAYARKNGPLTFSGGRAKNDRAFLEAAGFTVTERR